MDAKRCTVKNRLNLKWQEELSCQALATYSQKGLNKEDLERLQKKLPIVYPWNNQYNSLRNVYNRAISVFPIGIIMCKTVEHVSKSIKWCREHGFQFTVRSGAHSFLGFSVCDQIVIDVSRMDSIRIEKTEESRKCKGSIRSKRFLVVGPGARLGKVAEKLSRANLAVPLGSCINVAASGLALGGGISPSLLRLGGLMSDHLYSVTFVDAKGKVRVVKGCHHPKTGPKDAGLMWAMKGAGGGNFGVVVELTLNPCRFGSAVLVDIEFYFSDFPQVMSAWQDFAPFADPRLSCSLEATRKEVRLKGQWEGSLEHLLPILRPFLAPLNVKSARYLNEQTFADCARFWGTTEQMYFSANSIFWQSKMSEETIKLYHSHLKKAPSDSDSVSFTAMGGHVPKFPPSSFPWRESLFWGLHYGRTQDSDDFAKSFVWVWHLYKEVGAKASLEIEDQSVTPGYINIPQENLQHADLYLPTYYGAHVHPLQKVKTRLDPLNIFRFPQSIPPFP